MMARRVSDRANSPRRGSLLAPGPGSKGGGRKRGDAGGKGGSKRSHGGGGGGGGGGGVLARSNDEGSGTWRSDYDSLAWVIPALLTIHSAPKTLQVCRALANVIINQYRPIWVARD